MTAYTCKRQCCSVETVKAAKALTLNGERVTVAELAERTGLTLQAVRRRVDAHICLQLPRQHDKRDPRSAALNLTSDSDRLAAQFNSLPRIAA